MLPAVLVNLKFGRLELLIVCCAVTIKVNASVSRILVAKIMSVRGSLRRTFGSTAGSGRS